MVVERLPKKYVSDGELKRRWDTVRNVMEEKEMDCLIIQNNNQHLGGYVRYFTDIPAQYGLLSTVIFPLRKEIVIVKPSIFPSRHHSIDKFKRDFKYLNLAYAPTLNYSNRIEAEAVISEIKSLKPNTIGFVGKGFMSSYLYRYLKENLTGCRFENFTDEVDEIKAIKSNEEFELIKLTAEIQDKAWEALPSIVRAGKTENEIRAEVQELVVNLGSEEQLIYLGSAPPGQAPGLYPAFFCNRKLKKGDQFVILIEVNGPGGYYCESARNVCLGEPTKEIQEAWDIVVKAQKVSVDLLRPGTNPGDLLEANNRFLEEHGYLGEGRLYGHSQGYDLVERPALRNDETMKVKANMSISVHPLAVNDRVYMYVNDNFWVTENGAVRIHQAPQDLIVI